MSVGADSVTLGSSRTFFGRPMVTHADAAKEMHRVRLFIMYGIKTEREIKISHALIHTAPHGALFLLALSRTVLDGAIFHGSILVNNITDIADKKPHQVQQL